jgi:serine/threonine-protein kinase
MTELAVAPGEVIAGKYRIERVLGEGGMGVVVAAHHLQLDEKVAIKFLLPGALGSTEVVSRFVREARAAVKIKSQHVARVIDVSQLDDGSPYMVMEYLDGMDLSDWLEKRGPLGVAQAVDFVLQACDALAQAHALGIVHRDLKPANLFRIKSPDGSDLVKVLDFGISKMQSQDGSHSLTRTNALMGSPFYMSPEQLMASKTVDARSDIWSIGVILFELLSGRPPFHAEAITELAIKIANDPPPDLAALRADVPKGVVEAIAKCLEKQRESRFSDVGELATALAPFGAKHSLGLADRIVRTVGRAGALDVTRAPALFSGAPEVASVSEPRRSPADLSEPNVGGERVSGNTVGSWTQGGAVPETRAPYSRMGIVALAVAGLSGLVIVGALVLPSLRPHSVAPAAELPSALVTQSTPNAAPSAAISSVTPTPTPMPAPTPTPTPHASMATAGRTPADRPRASPLAGGKPAGSTAPPLSPQKPQCDPPYDIDANGTRRFKKECL